MSLDTEARETPITVKAAARFLGRGVAGSSPAAPTI